MQHRVGPAAEREQWFRTIQVDASSARNGAHFDLQGEQRGVEAGLAEAPREEVGVVRSESDDQDGRQGRVLRLWRD